MKKINRIIDCMIGNYDVVVVVVVGVVVLVIDQSINNNMHVLVHFSNRIHAL